MYNRAQYIATDTPLKKTLFKLFSSKDNLTIFDIGACEGEESIRYSRLFPNAKIYAFEPLPKNHKLINENLTKYQNKNICHVPVALSNVSGVAKFFISSGHPEYEPQNVDWDFGNKSSSLLKPNNDNMPKWLNFSTEIEVPTITLDVFVADNKIDKIDFAHMDVQGAELKVLEGAKKSLQTIKAIWLEVSNIELYQDQPLTTDIENYMAQHNFQLSATCFEGNCGDQLYLNKAYYKSFKLFGKTFYFRLSN